MQNCQESRPNYQFRGKTYNCSIEVTLAIIGGKWKAPILWHLGQQTMRFSELQRQFNETTRKMLTQQLRELERDLLINRKVYPQVPPKVEYSLTKKGESIIPVLHQLGNWGKGYFDPEPDSAVEPEPINEQVRPLI